jgi:chromosomal replication initiation ATPase DnaA
MTEIERLKVLRDYHRAEAGRFTNILRNDPKARLSDCMYVSADLIINGVCSYYGISKDTLKKRARTAYLVSRRRIATKLLHEYTSKNLQDIANILGYRNHATIIHHLRRIDEELSDNVYGNNKLKAEYKAVLNHLNLQDDDKENDATDGH